MGLLLLDVENRPTTTTITTVDEAIQKAFAHSSSKNLLIAAVTITKMCQTRYGTNKAWTLLCNRYYTLTSYHPDRLNHIKLPFHRSD